MIIESVYLLDDKVWLAVKIGILVNKLYVAGHREEPQPVTLAMVKSGDVPQEVIDWYMA